MLPGWIRRFPGLGPDQGISRNEAEMTTLKDFVKDTLSQISEGVSEFEGSSDAKTRVEAGIKGNLAGDAAASAGLLYLGAGKGFATVVKFDVAVTTEETEAAHGSAGIKVIPFNIGGGLDASTANTSVSRVQFNLPLSLSDPDEVQETT